MEYQIHDTILTIVLNLLTTRIYSVVFVFSRIKQKKGVEQMKKLLILTAVGAILATPAMAVQQCVALTTSSTCASSTGWDYYTRFSGICGTKSTVVQGVALCTSAGNTMTTFTTTNQLEFGTYAGANKVCWCRVIKPFVAYWTRAYNHTNEDECLKGCANKCATLMKSNSSFRQYLFDLTEPDDD